MYKLTERRLQQARSILETYRDRLYAQGSYRAGDLEGELREVWGIGYQELKDVFLDMYRKHDRYKYLSAYYMQYSNVPGPVSEFQPTLSELYTSLRDEPTHIGSVGDAFWERFRSPEAMELRREIDERRDSPDELKRLDTLRVRLRELTGEEY